MNQGNANSVLANAIFGTLFTSDAITGALQLSMAEALNTTDNGATFELTIRDGLMFTDGSPYNAEAVKLNFDRLRDPKNLGINSGMASEISMNTASSIVKRFDR
ncbi:ABC transporter substrate-binding protein [Rhodococcus sp. IEGM 1366]|uniref:ABC transporter substrate-binding protein n=1 Tax=Rhodococcus sp. IEGM 1366 TaxID=3082223 RepID=UPI002952E5FB|nr:ABC transporter substrate-binding protein [Rhodococcus sp. IEGM 1366]MDV8070968.1 ABC transporter substrate-binding protein [Rhodococcus sp. IEGM 1366]